MDASIDAAALAAVNIVAAYLSRFIDVPLIEDLLGPDGSEDVLRNINDQVFDDSMKIGSRKSAAPELFFPPVALKGLSFTTRVPTRLPAWLIQLLEVIEENASADEIFRKPGNGKRLKEYMAAVNKGAVDFRRWLRDGECNVHDLVSLLKSFINNFEDPLIPHFQHAEFLQTLGVASEQNRIEAIQMLLLLCPSSNRCILQRLFACLHAVHSQSAANRMTAANLAVCSTPCIIRKDCTQLAPDLQVCTAQRETALVQFMMQHHQTIFTVANNCGAVPRYALRTAVAQVPVWLKNDLATQEAERRQARQDECAGAPLAKSAKRPCQAVSMPQSSSAYTQMHLAALYHTAATVGAAGNADTQKFMQKISLQMENARMPGTPGTPFAARSVCSTPVCEQVGVSAVSSQARCFQMASPLPRGMSLRGNRGADATVLLAFGTAECVSPEPVAQMEVKPLPCGARGSANGGQWRVPLASNLSLVNEPPPPVIAKSSLMVERVPEQMEGTEHVGSSGGTVGEPGAVYGPAPIRIHRETFI